jgi:hypothetical protein
MAASRPGHNYSNIYTSDASRNHLGDVYNQYGPSPDQQAFRAVLDSLRYDGMDDRMDRLSSAERGTFEWALGGRDVESTMCRYKGVEEDEDVERYVESDKNGIRNDDDDDENTENDYDEDFADDGYDEDYVDAYDLWHSSKTIDGAFTDWLVSDEEEDNLFCFVGKPGSGKSTLMYASSKYKTAIWCTLH